MFIINRNGKTIVLTGWRAWLATAVLCLAGALVLVLGTFLVLGLTLTLAAVLMFVIPLAFLIAILSAGFRTLQGR